MAVCRTRKEVRKMNKYSERLYNGVIKENPTFVQMLGMCPTLAVTSTAINGLGMGLATTAVLTASNLMIGTSEADPGSGPDPCLYHDHSILCNHHQFSDAGIYAGAV